jgi:hypothetical protein
MHLHGADERWPTSCRCMPLEREYFFSFIACSCGYSVLGSHSKKDATLNKFLVCHLISILNMYDLYAFGIHCRKSHYHQLKLFYIF